MGMGYSYLTVLTESQDCSCPSDITPARDGPAHEYPDDGVAHANRTSQCNAPSGIMKPVSQAADLLFAPLVRGVILAPRGVILAGAVGTGNTVVRVLMRKTITSRGDVRRAGAVLSRRTGHDTAIGVTQVRFRGMRRRVATVL